MSETKVWVTEFYLKVPLTGQTVASVRVMRNKRTGSYLAVSDDVPGLMVPAKDMDQLPERLNESIAALIRVRGNIL